MQKDNFAVIPWDRVVFAKPGLTEFIWANGRPLPNYELKRHILRFEMGSINPMLLAMAAAFHNVFYLFEMEEEEDETDEGIFVDVFRKMTNVHGMTLKTREYTVIGTPFRSYEDRVYDGRSFKGMEGYGLVTTWVRHVFDTYIKRDTNHRAQQLLLDLGKGKGSDDYDRYLPDWSTWNNYWMRKNIVGYITHISQVWHGKQTTYPTLPQTEPFVVFEVMSFKDTYLSMFENQANAFANLYAKVVGDWVLWGDAMAVAMDIQNAEYAESKRQYEQERQMRQA